MKEKEVRRRITETIDILENADPEDSKYFTILLNSLLSLIVLPTEELKKEKGKKLLSGKYSEFLKSVNITPLVFNPIKTFDGDEPKYEKKTVNSFFRKLRNGIAHQNIEFVDADDEALIVFYNVASSGSKEKAQKCNGKCEVNRNKVIDFKIKVNASQLKKLALYIAYKYVEGTENG